MAQTVKSLPAVWETWVRSLGWEDPLEKEMATNSSILAWKIPWMESLAVCNPWGCKELDTTEQLHFTSSSLSQRRLFPPATAQAEISLNLGGGTLLPLSCCLSMLCRVSGPTPQRVSPDLIPYDCYC